MYSTSSKSRKELSKTGILRLGTIAKILMTEVITNIAFILAIIIDAKIAKIKASFLTFGIANI